LYFISHCYYLYRGIYFEISLNISALASFSPQSQNALHKQINDISRIEENYFQKKITLYWKKEAFTSSHIAIIRRVDSRDSSVTALARI